MSEETTFSSFGLETELCQRCEKWGWKIPTEIQSRAIPPALEGRDIVGISKTGTGKTAAFVLPILQHLVSNKPERSVLVLSPTRELALQTGKLFRCLGSFLKIKCTIIIGGEELADQKRELKKRNFHVLVATPGRLETLLECPQILSLSSIKFLVLDETDRLLDDNYEKALQVIFKKLPKERQSFLFSASINDEVRNLASTFLKEDVVWLGADTNCETVETLKEHMVNVPEREMLRMAFLSLLLKKISAESVIVFCKSKQDSLLLATFLVERGQTAMPFNSQLDQATRIKTLKFFKNSKPSILVATDLASRGLDIPEVECVINFHLPLSKTDYLHRVGRTARAGRGGMAFTLVNNKEFGQLQTLEKDLGKYLKPFQLEHKEIKEELGLIQHCYGLAQKTVEQMKEKEEEQLKRKFSYEEDVKVRKKRKHR